MESCRDLPCRQVLAQSYQVEDAYDQVLGIHVPEMAAGTEEDAVSEQTLAAASSPEENQSAVLSAAAV